MSQINLEQADRFTVLASQSLTINEMTHLYGGDSGSGGSSENETDPKTYIKEG